MSWTKSRLVECIGNRGISFWLNVFRSVVGRKIREISNRGGWVGVSRLYQGGRDLGRNSGALVVRCLDRDR